MEEKQSETEDIPEPKVSDRIKKKEEPNIETDKKVQAKDESKHEPTSDAIKPEKTY